MGPSLKKEGYTYEMLLFFK